MLILRRVCCECIWPKNNTYDYETSSRQITVTSFKLLIMRAKKEAVVDLKKNDQIQYVTLAVSFTTDILSNLMAHMLCFTLFNIPFNQKM